MIHFDPLVLLAGLLGYLVSIIASTALVLLFFRLNARMLPGKKIMQLFVWDRASSPTPPSPAPAIVLGAATLSQAYLLKHAVFVIMSLVQDFLLLHGKTLLAGRIPWAQLLQLMIVSAILMTGISALSVLSIWIAGAFFNWMTGELDEIKEIVAGNIAISVLFAFILFAVTAILNEGIEDVSRAIIPYSRSGVVRLP